MLEFTDTDKGHPETAEDLIKAYVEADRSSKESHHRGEFLATLCNSLFDQVLAILADEPGRVVLTPNRAYVPVLDETGEVIDFRAYPYRSARLIPIDVPRANPFLMPESDGKVAS